MSRIVVLAIACMYALAAVHAFAPAVTMRLFEHRQQLLAAHAELKGISETDMPTAYFHTQYLDHFENGNDQTWLQRYFVNDTFWEKPDGPVFIFIEGEGAANPLDALIGEHMELAAVYKALVLVVEHRYYGASNPTPTLSTENLKYLSSQQALGDLAQFYSFARTKWNLTDANTAICFGGSYPGALSSWFREKFPQVVFAAVASSAPVQAREDFTGYNDVIHDSLEASEVGGSSACVANVEAAFTTITKTISTPEGLAALATQFNSCQKLSTPNDTATFVSNLAGNFQETVQYNNELPGSPTIEAMCGFMTQPGDPVANLATMTKKLFLGGGCMDNSYSDSMVSIMNITVNPKATGVGIRQWTYQTCTQFGYYQTCEENTNCPFPSDDIMSLASNLDICWNAFGITADEVAARIAFTNDYYGGSPPSSSTSNVLFVDGTIDPWHALSVLTPFSKSSPTPLFVTGAAHCAWMMPSMATDPAPLKAAREAVSKQIAIWLQQAAAERE